MPDRWPSAWHALRRAGLLLALRIGIHPTGKGNGFGRNGARAFAEWSDGREFAAYFHRITSAIPTKSRLWVTSCLHFRQPCRRTLRWGGYFRTLVRDVIHSASVFPFGGSELN